MLPPTATGSVNALNSELSWKKISQKICSKEELLTQFHLVVVAHTHTCILLTGAIKLTKIPFGVAEFFRADNQKPLHDIYHTVQTAKKVNYTEKM